MAVSAAWKRMEEVVEWKRSLIGIELKPREWYKNTEVTVDALRIFLDAIADFNPLYRDAEHARRSHYEKPVAPPSFLESVMNAGAGSGAVGNSYGVPNSTGLFGGTEWEFYKPVFVGDRFNYTQTVVDVVEKQMRQLGRTFITYTDTKYYNQRHETVGKARSWVISGIREGLPAEAKPRPIYQYSDAELKKIDETYRKGPSLIRGSTPRYWEDVQVGEEIPPMVRGPLTENDMLAWLIGGGADGGVHALTVQSYSGPPPDLAEHRGKPIFLEESRISTAEWMRRTTPAQRKATDYSMGMNHIFPVQSGIIGPGYDLAQLRKSYFITFFTHWQGDAGFLKRIRVELRGVNQIGDTLWFKGRVSGKEIVDGEHVVHIDCWGENQEGRITTPGSATVALPSKG